jgi:hypothetical protein
MNILVPEPIEQTFVEIRDTLNRQLVTAIEVLSMTNKRGDGLVEYQRKRREMLAGPAHFIEIDLLRAGQRFPVEGTLPSAPYFVFLSRQNRRPRAELWPIALECALPTVIVPLLPGDDDVELDLQVVLTTVYHAYRYGQPEEHQGDTLPPLSPEQMVWVEEKLRAAGLR